MNIEQGLNELTEKMTSMIKTPLAERQEVFATVRADTRGAIITAHRDLGAANWTEADDKMLDMVTAWLDNLKAR